MLSSIDKRAEYQSNQSAQPWGINAGAGLLPGNWNGNSSGIDTDADTDADTRTGWPRHIRRIVHD